MFKMIIKLSIILCCLLAFSLLTRCSNKSKVNMNHDIDHDIYVDEDKSSRKSDEIESSDDKEGIINSNSDSETTKPSTNNNSSSSSSFTNTDNFGNSSSGSNTETLKPSENTECSASSAGSSSLANSGTSTTPSHIHEWVEVTETIEHDPVWVVDKEAWTETIEEIVYICNGCNSYFSNVSEWMEHCKKMDKQGEYSHSGYTTDYIYNEKKHNAEGHYDEGWTETITIGYICSCGASK